MRFLDRYQSHPMNREDPVGAAPRRRVALIGGAPSATYADPEPPWEWPEWAIWGLNSMWAVHDRPAGLRADRWFELHPYAVQTPAEVDAVLTCPVPIYVFDPEEWPQRAGARLTRYPTREVVGAFAEWGMPPAFASTMAYQVALALHEGAWEIGLWGIDLAFGTCRERAVERGNLAMWLGFAAGRGVKVSGPSAASLMGHEYRYGQEYEAELRMVRSYVQMVALDTVSRYGVTPTAVAIAEDQARVDYPVPARDRGDILTGVRLR